MQHLKQKPAYESCGRHDLRYRVDGSYYCRQCGFDSKNVIKEDTPLNSLLG